MSKDEVEDIDENGVVEDEDEDKGDKNEELYEVKVKGHNEDKENN